MPLTESWGPIMWFAYFMAGKSDDLSRFQGWRVMLCVGNLCDWEWQVCWLGVAGFLETHTQWHAFEVAALFSTVRLAILLLENLKLSVRSSLLSFLTFLLTSLSYSCGLAHLAAVACPSTPLPLSCSFLTLPSSIPCREVTFTSPRVATPRGTAKSPHK